jgi:protein phosphatase
MVADDEGDQRATPAAFDLLHRAATHRLTRARLTVVDATNLKPGDRRPLLDLARRLDRPAVAIVLALPAELARARNVERSDRTVADEVVARGAEATIDLASRPEGLATEGFRAVHVLSSARAVDRVSIVREGRLPRRGPNPAAGGRGATTPDPPGARSAGRPVRTS